MYHNHWISQVSAATQKQLTNIAQVINTDRSDGTRSTRWSDNFMLFLYPNVFLINKLNKNKTTRNPPLFWRRNNNINQSSIRTKWNNSQRCDSTGSGYRMRCQDYVKLMISETSETGASKFCITPGSSGFVYPLKFKFHSSKEKIIIDWYNPNEGGKKRWFTSVYKYRTNDSELVHPHL